MGSKQETKSANGATQSAVSPEDRIWIDGCFDFFHHGHAGVMLQARQLGKELYVGVHSDEEITAHKGDPVMNMKERLAAAEACRWTTAVVPDAPYVTSLSVVSEHNCHYVVHGDDITSDSSGQDCYRYVKQAGRMKIVKRTPDISTTDLVGRMLLCTKQHHMRPLQIELVMLEEGDDAMRDRGKLMRERIRAYASDESGLKPGVQVAYQLSTDVKGSENYYTFPFPWRTDEAPSFIKHDDQHFVYVDGSFDLFSSGHIEFLRRVAEIERFSASEDSWNSAERRDDRLKRTGKDYDRAFIVAGIHDDATVNEFKGSNYPIMSIYERGLCVLQCKYVDAVVFGAPYDVTDTYLHSIPMNGKMERVYHGKTNFFDTEYDGYSYPREQGMLREVPAHDFQDVNAAQIYRRILGNKERFEERQRKKGVKALGEAEARRVELEVERAASKG